MKTLRISVIAALVALVGCSDDDDPDPQLDWVQAVDMSDGAILSYWVDGGKPRRIGSRFRSLPVSWFYEE